MSASWAVVANFPIYNEACAAGMHGANQSTACLGYPSFPKGKDFHSALSDWFLDIRNTTAGAALPYNFSNPQCIRSPLFWAAPHPVQRYVVYDWGSSSVRLLVADIDPQVPQGGIQERFRSTIALPPNYEEADLPGRIAAWVAIRWALEAFFPADPIHHRAIATAGLRVSHLGQQLRSVVSSLGISVRIISQTEEGRLALQGLAYRYPQVNLQKALAWDIGGKSMQWTVQTAGDDVQVWGSDGGLFHFLEAWKALEGGLSMDSVRSFSKARRLARLFFTEGYHAKGRKGFHYTAQADLRQLTAERQVYGIGPIHHLFAHHYVKQVLGVDFPYYTQEHLQSVILDLIFRSEQEVMALRPPELHTNKKDELLLGLVLLQAAMEVLKIDRVLPVNIDNREGLLAEVWEHVKSQYEELSEESATEDHERRY